MGCQESSALYAIIRKQNFPKRREHLESVPVLYYVNLSKVIPFGNMYFGLDDGDLPVFVRFRCLFLKNGKLLIQQFLDRDSFLIVNPFTVFCQTLLQDLPQVFKALDHRCRCYRIITEISHLVFHIPLFMSAPRITGLRFKTVKAG